MQISLFSSLVSKFQCTCPKPCAMKEFVLINTQSNPAKQDLSNLLFLGKSVCSKPEIVYKNKEIGNQAKIRILLLRKESVRFQSVFYNAVMAMADGYNAIGLFFGITFLSVYDAVEDSLVRSKKSIHSFRRAKESADDLQLRERLLINKLLLMIANFKEAASITTQTRVSDKAQTHLPQRSQGYLSFLWLIGWICCVSALIFQVGISAFSMFDSQVILCHHGIRERADQQSVGSVLVNQRALN